MFASGRRNIAGLPFMPTASTGPGRMVKGDPVRFCQCFTNETATTFGTEQMAVMGEAARRQLVASLEIAQLGGDLRSPRRNPEGLLLRLYSPGVDQIVSACMQQ